MTPWRSLLSRVRPHRRTLIGAAALGLLGAAGGLAQPLAAREVIEALADDESLLRPLLLLGALVVMGALVGAAAYWLLERTAERIVLGTRRDLAGRLLRLRLGAFDTQAPGDLVARATSDSTLLGSVASTALVQLFTGSLTFVGAVVLMTIVDPVLLGVTVGVLVVVGGGISFAFPRISRATERQQAAVGALGAALERSLGALRTVKASGAERRETERVGAAATLAYERGMQSAGYQAAVSVAAGLAIQVAFLAVLGVGGARVASGTLSVGDLIAFLLYLFYLTDPISNVVMGVTQLQQGLAAVRRIDGVADLPAEEGAPEQAGESTAHGRRATAGGRAADGKRSVPADRAAMNRGPLAVLDAVSFAYSSERGPVLDRVSFALPERGLTAVVGPSGAGKTTLFALLERFYEPTQGSIAFAGRPLPEWPLGALRAQIGYVEQDAPVLAGSLRENLRYAAPDADDSDLHEVLRVVRLEDVVARLPDGLDTEVGTRGTALSGGERQRVAIARALLRRPRLLLLDEASSQLDAVNEASLREAVARAAERCSVVAIAHRLSTVISADAIVVLADGRVRAVGTHAELVARDSLYAELAATQLAGPMVA